MLISSRREREELRTAQCLSLESLMVVSSNVVMVGGCMCWFVVIILFEYIYKTQLVDATICHVERNCGGLAVCLCVCHCRCRALCYCINVAVASKGSSLKSKTRTRTILLHYPRSVVNLIWLYDSHLMGSNGCLRSTLWVGHMFEQNTFILIKYNWLVLRICTSM